MVPFIIQQEQQAKLLYKYNIMEKKISCLLLSYKSFEMILKYPASCCGRC